MPNTETRLIRTWEELGQLPANDKFKIVLKESGGCGWIKPVSENEEMGVNSYYLHTHTFYDSNCEEMSKLLQECGFNVELENWDKPTKKKS